MTPEQKFLNACMAYNDAEMSVRLAALDFIVHETKACPDQTLYFYGPEDDSDDGDYVSVYITATVGNDTDGFQIMECEVYSIYFDAENYLTFETNSNDFKYNDIKTNDLITIAHAIIAQKELLAKEK